MTFTTLAPDLTAGNTGAATRLLAGSARSTTGDGGSAPYDCRCCDVRGNGGWLASSRGNCASSA